MRSLTLQKPRGMKRWLALYRLYRSAFPRSERKPFSVMLKKSREGKMDLWCLEEGGQFRGLVITINSPSLILVDYLAIAENFRGQGVGTAALDTIREHYKGRDIFLEIESVYEDTPNLPERLRRKAFYLRCGLVPMKVMVWLFGVKMELLGFDGCRIDYDTYHAFYRDNLGQWAANRISSDIYPEV